MIKCMLNLPFLKILTQDSTGTENRPFSFGCMFKSFSFRMAFRFVFSEAMKQMYGIKHNLSSLPVMPSKEGTWSVMHSWALPTKSFLEFVMFSRFRLLNPVLIRFRISLLMGPYCLSSYCFVD